MTANFHLARILTTHPNDEVRDPAVAVRHAEQVAAATGLGDPRVFDLLCRAYAAAGRLDKAIATCRKAMGIAQSRGDADLQKAIRQRLEALERRRKPQDS